MSTTDTHMLAEAAVYLELRRRDMEMSAARRVARELRARGMDAPAVTRGFDHPGPDRDMLDAVLCAQGVAIH